MKRLVFVFFLFSFSVYGQICQVPHECSFVHELQSLDCLAQEKYPVTWQHGHVQFLVVPFSQDLQAQTLIAAAYRVLACQYIETVVLVSQAVDTNFYGVGLPLYRDELVFQNLSFAPEILNQLSGHDLFHYYQPLFHAHDGIALQCVFCEFYIKNARIVPLVVGKLSDQDACRVAKKLALVCNRQTVVIMSADIARTLQCMDVSPFEYSKTCAVYEKDCAQIQALQAPTYKAMCAVYPGIVHYPIFSLFGHFIEVFSKNRSSYFVGYAVSHGRDLGVQDLNSYASFIFQEHQSYPENYIGAYEQKQLLQVARQELEEVFYPSYQRTPCMISYEMLQPHGLFASLYAMSDHGIILRGCMGRIKTQTPLVNLVCQMVEQAATRDARFYAIRPKELQNTIISLSLITDMKQVEHAHEVGEFDGIMLQYDDKEAVHLPFKYPTFAWNAEMALTKLSCQMGMTRLVWKKPRAKIFTFRPQVFQEE